MELSPKENARNNSLIVLIVDVFYWLHRRDFANLFLFVWVCAYKIYTYTVSTYNSRYVFSVRACDFRLLHGFPSFLLLLDFS